MKSITRFFATASLVALLAACGGEGGKEREDGPSDREKPSLGSSQDDDDDDEEKKERKESEGKEDGDDD